MGKHGLKTDKSGRSSATHLRKFKPKNRPKECGFEQFCWMPLEMMEHEAFRALSLNSLRLLNRLLIEHVQQGGQENGRLVVTHEALRDYGLNGSSVREAIDECVAFGFIRVKAGGRWAGTNRPNRFQLTWLGWLDDDDSARDPENTWKGATADFIARWQTQRSATRRAKRRWRATKKTDQTPELRSTALRNCRVRVVK